MCEHNIESALNDLDGVKKILDKDHFVYIVGKNAEKGNLVLNEIKNSNLEFFQCDLSEKSALLCEIKCSFGKSFNSNNRNI